MKRLVTLLLCMVVVLSGCHWGSYSVTRAQEHNSANRMAMTYERFTGYKASSFTVEADATCQVMVDVVSDSGKINLSITDDAGNSYYQGTDMDTCAFTVTLDVPGDYQVRVDAEKHSGSYDISWEKQ